jgi:NADH dehydrogenase [ubiquinone] 1 alpha subcomplex assembly factor 2
MQWLRHTRFDPPSIAEQEADIVRQERIKLLAAEADRKWAEKPSVLDKPDMAQPVQMLESRDPNASVGQTNVDEQVHEQPKAQEAKRDTEPEESPWNKLPASTNPGQDWQPDSWTARPAKRRG